MGTAFIYSDQFWKYDYGSGHPMRPIRLKLTWELIRSCGLLDIHGSRLIEARKATVEEVLYYHNEDYIRVLSQSNTGTVPEDGERYGLGYGDNPVFEGVYDWSLYSTGASVQGAELVSKGEADIAFNICGGLHHARAGRASGFCYINDPVVAICHLVRAGKRVLYVDIDAHHGDGVQAAFYDTDRVLTVSIHESGLYLFPGTGLPEEAGEGVGEGYSINIPLPPGAGDELFCRAFGMVVPGCVERFKPDILVTQLGVDTFRTDPITHLNLTTNGLEKMVRCLGSFSLPWLALGGGGYNLSNVARGWAIAWAIMNGVDVPDNVPDQYMETAERYGIHDHLMKDIPFKAAGREKAAMLRDLDTVIERLSRYCPAFVKRA